MKELLDPGLIQQWLSQAQDWILTNVLIESTLLELGAILVAGTLAWLLARPLGKRLSRLEERHADYPVIKAIWQVIKEVMFPALWLILQWVASAIAAAADQRVGLLTVTSSLLAAWVVIRIASLMVKDPFWRHTVATTAWIIAALNIIGLLDPTLALLDSAGVTFGSVRISALAVLKGILALAFLLWGATVVSNIFESRIKAAPNLTPSVRVLLSKLFKISLIILVVLAAVSSVGIDISAFAVFGGAIGVGIGFGLQRIVSNLISGVILLLDKSIKPGDVIAIDDEYGRVDSLGARYVSVSTRDGIEFLIPNEDLIVNRVENWSHSQDYYRMRMTIGVHYQSDVREAIALCLEAANETERVLTDNPPVCQIRAFGDSSVDLDLRYWINDPMNGRANVNGEILLKIWDKFHEHGIEIPYPQRDLHLRTPDASKLDQMVKSSA
ncbi:MAG: mechanosensitive ion channel domain-containing protein [Gammaproteobacteria bacterium]